MILSWPGVCPNIEIKASVIQDARTGLNEEYNEIFHRCHKTNFPAQHSEIYLLTCALIPRIYSQLFWKKIDAKLRF